MRTLKKLLFAAALLAAVSGGGNLFAQYVQPMSYPHYSFPNQVNIGNGTAKVTNSSAYLEIGPASGASKGMLWPRLTTTARDAIATPATGLFIYNTTLLKPQYYNGTSWQDVGSSIDTSNKWVNTIYRIPGIDSFYFNIGGTIYAVKDSTGGSAYTFTTPLVESGGTVSLNGLSGYGSSGDLIRSTGSALEYFTPSYLTSTPGIDDVLAQAQSLTTDRTVDGSYEMIFDTDSLKTNNLYAYAAKIDSLKISGSRIESDPTQTGLGYYLRSHAGSEIELVNKYWGTNIKLGEELYINTNTIVSSGVLATNAKFAIPSTLTPSQITSDQNNYNPTGFSGATGRTVLRLSSDASRNLTGLVASIYPGEIVIINNIVSNDIVLKDESTSSTAANRFAFSGDVTLTADQSITIIYDATSARWRQINTPGGGGGAADFTDLGDVPSSYSGQSLKAVRVNSGETGLEFYTPSGSSVSFGTAGQIPYTNGTTDDFSYGGVKFNGTDLEIQGQSGLYTYERLKSVGAGTYWLETYISTSSDVNVHFNGNNYRIVQYPGNYLFAIGPTEISLNDAGLDRNIRMEGDNDANLLYLDAGVDKGSFGSASNLGSKLNVTSTSTQQAWYYDASNYFNTTVSSAGAVTFDATGASAGFTFSDPIKSTRIIPVTSFTTSASSLTPDFTAYRGYGYTALAANLTINAPTGSPSNGEEWWIYIKDDGTSRTLSWNAAYVEAGITLPASTTTGKGHLIGGRHINSVYYATYNVIQN